MDLTESLQHLYEILTLKIPLYRDGPWCCSQRVGNLPRVTQVQSQDLDLGPDSLLSLPLRPGKGSVVPQCL